MLPAAALLATLLAQTAPPAQAAPSAPATQAPLRPQYELVCHQRVTNTVTEPLTNLAIYVPNPSNDSVQQLADYLVEHPVPVQIANRTDNAGNRVKRVNVRSLPPNGSVDIGFSAVVSLGGPAKVDLLGPRRAVEPLSIGTREECLKDGAAFQLADPGIAGLAADLRQKHPDDAQRAMAIHALVASTVALQPGESEGRAAQALAAHAGTADDLTVLFAALCRATGIPTRLVTATTLPAGAALPYQDRQTVRWARAWLEGFGWVDFDPALDAATAAKDPQSARAHAGQARANAVVLAVAGEKSDLLGPRCAGTTSNTSATSMEQWFTWSQGTQAQLADARKAMVAGDTAVARTLLTTILDTQPGTLAARDARQLLLQLDRPNSGTP
ncbi:MAG: transglutaminase family protein [Phycisphaerales bacterium]